MEERLISTTIRGMKLSITNTKFENNTATFNGGAVHGESQTISIKSSSFVSNSVRQWGGALHLSQSHASLNASSFVDNSADQGKHYL